MVAKAGHISSMAELSRIMRSLALAPTATELKSYYKGKGTSTS